MTIAEPAATFLNFILKECDLDQYNLQSLKCLYTGGERVQPTLLSEYHKRHIALSQLFGMTETSTLTWLPTEYAYENAGSIGKAIFHGDLKIVDREGLEIGLEETEKLQLPDQFSCPAIRKDRSRRQRPSRMDGSRRAI